MLAVAVSLAVAKAGVEAEAPFWTGVILVLLGALAEVFPYHGENKGAAGSVAFIPYAAAILALPDWRVLALVAVAQCGVQLFHRRAALKAVFNTGQFALTVGVSLLVFQATSPDHYWLSGAGFFRAVVAVLPSAVATSAAMILVNKLAVSAVVSAASRQPFPEVLATSLHGYLPLFLLQMIFGVYLAWLAVNLGVLGTAGMVLPMVAVRQLSKTTVELTKVTEELLDLMVAAIEARDPYTSGHSQRVASSAVTIAEAIGLRPAEVERVQVAALLHDVGKIHEEFARILAKEGRLTPEEWEIMKRHPIRSAELVALVSSLRDVVPGVRHHHENWDGTGYPSGIRGEAIPLASRIIMFADTLDAITTDRPYRKALDPEEARREFQKFRGRQFDPSICDVVCSDAVWPTLYERARTVQETTARSATNVA